MGVGPAGAEQGAPLRMAGLHTAAASAPRPGAGTDTPGRSRGPVRSRVSTEAKQKSGCPGPVRERGRRVRHGEHGRGAEQAPHLGHGGCGP